MSIRARFVGLALVALSTACATPVSQPTPVPPEPSVEVLPEPSPAYDEAALQALLDQAERALQEDRLLTPEGVSAYNYFRQALAMAPDDARAGEGFERIVERYLALANRAIEDQRWAAARTMLERAGTVDGMHPGIAPLRRQVELLANARRDILALDQAAVRARHKDVEARLKSLGLAARQTNARVTIRASSDADGRWIYAQLNKAPGTHRIRASLHIGAPPKVTVTFLDDSE